jgi:hypothetical protein
MGSPWTEPNLEANHWWENPSSVGKNRTQLLEDLSRESATHQDLLITSNIDQYGKNFFLFFYFFWLLVGHFFFKFNL